MGEDFREEWEAKHPLGFVEHRQMWDPRGDFGSWVLEHNTVININDMLFLHGGLGPSALGMPR